MNEKREKALLEFVQALAAWYGLPDQDGVPHEMRYTGFNEWRAVRGKAKRYLATLEPKPEPKRGVEEILITAMERVEAEALSWSKASWHLDGLGEALRLYREERERVAKVAVRLRAMEEHGGYTEYSELADELERRDG